MNWISRTAGIGLLFWLLFSRNQLVFLDRPKLVFCDVGQGDAILFSYKYHQLLIDAGPDFKIIDCLNDHMPPFDTSIEIVVATHPDSDHIKGFSAIFSLYSVREIWLVPMTKKTVEFELFLAAVSRKMIEGSRLIWVDQGQRREVYPGLVVDLISPDVNDEILTSLVTNEKNATETLLSDAQNEKDAIQNWDNERSIVLNIDYFLTKILLTGDVGKETEQALVHHQLIGDVDILKVGHHGSKTSTTTQFLQQVRPEVAVISCGKNNAYGHPAVEVVQRLLDSGAEVLRTDEEGDIEFAVSEKGYTLR